MSQGGIAVTVSVRYKGDDLRGGIAVTVSARYSDDGLGEV